MAWFSVTYRHHRGNTYSVCERCYRVWYEGRSVGFIIERIEGALPGPCAMCGTDAARGGGEAVAVGKLSHRTLEITGQTTS